MHRAVPTVADRRLEPRTITSLGARSAAVLAPRHPLS
jgi:hypothetical protein